jgi:hypothetical protein
MPRALRSSRKGRSIYFSRDPRRVAEAAAEIENLSSFSTCSGSRAAIRERITLIFLRLCLDEQETAVLA